MWVDDGTEDTTASEARLLLLVSLAASSFWMSLLYLGQRLLCVLDGGSLQVFSLGASNQVTCLGPAVEQT